MAKELKGCSILEKDINNETLWVWSFPTVTDGQKKFVLRKYEDINSQAQVFAFCRHGKYWFYIYTAQVFETDGLPGVKQCALVLWTPEYHPEKYGTLSRVLSKSYCKSGDPVKVLQLYLSVLTKGSCTTDENGTYFTKMFQQCPDNASARVGELILAFGLETILIYTALLLKKRLFVYDHDLSNLLQTVETLPLLMTHRNLTNSIYPWVHLVAEELNDLKINNGYIAGCMDSNLSSRTDLFDIFVNVAAREVSISPQARESLTMTKTHKDIALFLVQLAESQSTEIVSEIARKTQELLTQLRSLATTVTPDGQKMFSIESLRERRFPPPLENFLFNLAVFFFLGYSLAAGWQQPMAATSPSRAVLTCPLHFGV